MRAFCSYKFDSSEVTKDYSELLNTFSYIDRMEAEDFIFLTFFSIKSFFPLSHMGYFTNTIRRHTFELQGVFSNKFSKGQSFYLHL